MNHFDVPSIEKNINYHFSNQELIKQAFSHSSYVNEKKIKGYVSYERLEFLGDAVLELLSSEYLFNYYKDMPEGKLTKLRASIVCEHTLSSVAKELHYGDFVLLSKGEELTGGRNRNSILCDLFESVLGAIYLDGGMEPAKQYVYTHLMTDIENKQLFYDAKTTLQELVQKNGSSAVSYVLLDEKGPDHNKVFVTAVCVDNKQIAIGEGSSKKNAEQMAAYQAILQLKK